MPEDGQTSRAVTLSRRDAAYVDRLLAAGGYESADDVVRAGLEALRDRDEDMDSWLYAEVAAAYDAVKADPSLEIPAEDVFREIRALSGGAAGPEARPGGSPSRRPLGAICSESTATSPTAPAPVSRSGS